MGLGRMRSGRENMDSYDQEFVIVGAGIAGLTLALLLHRMEKQLVLVEKRPRDAFLDEELRSINFTLTARGLATLHRLGLRDRVLEKAVRLNHRVVHHRHGGFVVQRYGSCASHAIYSIRRKALLQILQEEVDALSGVSVLYGAVVSSVDCNSGAVIYVREGRDHVMRARTIFAADGVFSQVRSSFLQQNSVYGRLQDFPWRYMEMHGDKEFVAALQLRLNAVHVWPGEGALLVGIPNPDGTVALMFLSDAIQESNRKRFVEIFSTHFPHVPMTSTMTTQLQEVPLGRLVTGSLSRWSHEDRVVFVGDACHAVLPFYGQGMNAALEDCFVLCDLLDQEASRAQAFAAYEARRRPQTNALAILSQAHFDNLQPGSHSLRWQAGTLMDLLLAHLTAGTWFHEYEKIAHTNIPYDLILNRLKFQKTLKRRSGLWLLEVGLRVFISLSRLLRSQLWKHPRSLSRVTTSTPSPR